MTCPIGEWNCFSGTKFNKIWNPVASWVTTVLNFFSYEEICLLLWTRVLKECYSFKSKAKQTKTKPNYLLQNSKAFDIKKKKNFKMWVSSMFFSMLNFITFIFHITNLNAVRWANIPTILFRFSALQLNQYFLEMKI